MLFVGDAFDYTTPFRALLSDIAEALGQHPQNYLELPPYEAWEDFIEGTLRFGSLSLRIYYEHSLSFLALTDSQDMGRDHDRRVKSCVLAHRDICGAARV
jgi:hypothetical protein